LDAVFEVELGEDPGDVVGDGVRAQREVSRDLVVALAAGELLEDVELAVGQGGADGNRGLIAMVKAVLPGMRERRSGTIVNISSIGARVAPAGSGYYAATKAAVEGLTGSLRKELEPLGITAMAIEPGGFRTDFAGRSLQQSADPIAHYADTAGRRRKEHDTTHGTQPGDPAKAARAIIDVVGSESPPALLLLGEDAVTAIRRVLDAERAELEAWEHVSLATAFDGAVRDD
jgi:NAD(P)-dependent dehydrogenase (short-subunit alcohol dehydrogenase family)